MRTILLVAPQTALEACPPLPGAVPVVWTSAADVVTALSSHPHPAVIVSTGLPEPGLRAVAEAVRAHPAPCIEVQDGRWDGESHSPLSAACRGVIAGFGAAGITRALEALTSE